MRSRWLRLLPALGLAVLIGFVWVTDRSSPAYPNGEFGPLMLVALVATGIILVGVVWRALRGR